MPAPPANESPSSVEPVEGPKPDSSPAESASVQTVVPVQAKGIEVVALRAGYFNGQRKKEGDKFTISTMSKLGDWMKLTDAKAERERQIQDKAKKLAGKKSAE